MLLISLIYFQTSLLQRSQWKKNTCSLLCWMCLSVNYLFLIVSYGFCKNKSKYEATFLPHHIFSCFFFLKRQKHVFVARAHRRSLVINSSIKIRYLISWNFINFFELSQSKYSKICFWDVFSAKTQICSLWN